MTAPRSVAALARRREAARRELDPLLGGGPAPVSTASLGLDAASAVDRFVAAQQLPAPQGPHDRLLERDGSGTWRPVREPVVAVRGGPQDPVQVAGPQLRAAVSSGRTFALRRLDQTAGPLRRFAEQLELATSLRVGIDALLCGGGGPIGGGSLLIGINGRGRWRLGATTVEFGPDEAVSVPPGVGPVLEGLPVGPVVVLVVRLAGPTAADLASASLRVAAERVGPRRDLVHGTVDPAAVRADLTAAAAEAFVEWAARTPTRARSGFSRLHALGTAWATGEGPDEAVVRLSAPGGVYLTSDAGRGALALAGWAVSLDPTIDDLLATLLTGAVDARTVPANLRPAALALLRAGLIEVGGPVGLPGRGARTDGPDRAWGPAPAPIAVVSTAWRGEPVRPLDPRDPIEASLAGAAAAGRAAVAAELTHDLGFDLDDALRAARPRRGRLDRAAFERLDGAAALDEVLADRDLDPDLFKVARDALPYNRPPPAALFTDPGEPGAPRLAALGAVHRTLLDGTTVIALGIDRLVPRWSSWVGRVERATQRRSGANAYLSHGAAPGFGAHWDDHDVLVVHVAGRKAWEVFEPFVPRPVRPHHPLAVGPVRWWAGDLEPGDVLFIPRGWGHRVDGRGGVSAHLTLPLRAVTHGDVLRADAVGSSSRPALRRDLGAPAPAPAGGWRPGPGTSAAEVLARWAARVPGRWAGGLWAPASAERVRWVVPDPVALRAAGPDGGDVALVAGGRVLRLAREHAPAVARVLAGVADLAGDEAAVARDLAAAGVVTIG